MRARLNDVVAGELADGGAVPALTCYDFTTALAVVSAAEEAARPVILLVAPKTAAGPGGMRFMTALRGLADAASVPVLVQLDHAADPELILAAATAGADSVLADGSPLEPAANAAFVAGVVRSLAGLDIVVEAELGALPGDEDDASAAAEADRFAGMTDPALVTGFLAASGAGLLAVAVGNVHGNYKGAPHLDWNRLGAVKAAARTVPLVLHGASGLDEADLRRAAGAGIGKVNINTELRTSTLAAVADALPGMQAAGQNMLGLLGVWSGSAAATAAWALELLRPGVRNL